MLDHCQVTPPVPIDVNKQKCSSGHTQYYYTVEGISYQCRHCKKVEVVLWEEIIRNYRELVNTTNS